MSGRSGSNGGGAVWPRAILFDLDGTLIDSAPDIASAVNRLLGQYDLAPLSLDQVRSMIGNGIRKLVERAFRARGVDLDDGDLSDRTDRMMKVYAENLTEKTVVMEGADDVVAAYHHCGVRIGVVTNKPEGFTREILAHFGFSEKLAAVVGGDSGLPRKPAPDMLLHALSAMDVDVAGALMVGDSPADIEAARAAGITSVAVRGGYTNIAVEDLGADRVIETLNGLPEAIEGLKR